MVTIVPAEDKLSEAKYFLSRLQNMSDTIKKQPSYSGILEDEFKYTLSAFVQAWRSVFDVLLYDYAEKYFGVERGEQVRVDQKMFHLLANSKFGCSEAKKFIKWHERKEKDLVENHLWWLRVFCAHMGTPDTSVTTPSKESWIYVAPSGVSSGSVPPSTVTSGYQTIAVTSEQQLYVGIFTHEVMLQMCSSGYDQMRNIVEEARKRFKFY